MAWALSELRRELALYQRPHSTRRLPEYYLFATNVRLSAVEGKGGKDRATAILQAFAEETGLKGFDIWDYDRLRAYLDAYESIRRAYYAWITPGDVLARVVESLDTDKVGLHDALSLFLQKELIASQYVNLEQAGHAPEEAIPLSRVFVDLPVADGPPHELAEGLTPHEERRFISQIAELGVTRLGQDGEYPPSSPGDPGALQPGRYVLIGGPGQGKTTVGQFLCQLFRAAVLGSVPSDSLPPEVEAALTDVRRSCKGEGLEIPRGRRFPLHVVLNRFASALASPDGPTSLLGYLADGIQRRVDIEVKPATLRDWLRAYPWLLVLDGLDEVPPSANREAVLRAVNDFWIDVSRDADSLVIATTRPQGYTDDFSPRHYEHQWLLPLPPAEALRYAGRLVEARYAADSDRRDKIIGRLERASTQESTGRLMRSPLQVTIMATLVDRMGQPPQDRWSLFNDYYNVIYQREMERDIPAAALLRDYAPDIHTIHRRVGLLLQVESEGAEGSEARLSGDRLGEVVAARLDEEGHEGSTAESLTRQIIEAAAHRLVFLVGLEEDRVGFEVRSLQEFMAAECLMDAGDDIAGDRLRAIAPAASWRNVFTFAAGKCFSNRQHLRDTVYTICAELSRGDDPFQRDIRGGSGLALDLLEDGSARNQPKYSRLLLEEALDLTSMPPTLQQLRLADVYDEVDADHYQQRLVEALAGELPGSLGAWNALLSLVTRRVTWAHELMDQEWPVEPVVQKRLFQALSRYQFSPVVVAKLSEFLRSNSPFFIWRLPLGRLSIDGPPWLRALAELSRALAIREEGAVPIAGVSPDELAFSMIPMRSAHADAYTVLRDLADLRDSWLPLQAASRFASDPSPSELARALATAAEHGCPADWELLSRMAPWPAAACLAISREREELERLADAAAEGHLGDPDAWLQAEARWRSRGVTLDDVAHSASNDYPFDSMIGKVGFPFTAGRWRVGRGQPGVSPTLIDWYRQACEPRTRRALAGWLFDQGASGAFPSDGDAHEIGPSEFAEMVVDVFADGRKYFSLSVLSTFSRSHVDSPAALDAWDRIGRHRVTASVFGPNEFDPHWLWEAFVSDRSRLGVARLLALTLPYAGAESLAQQLPSPHEAEDPGLRGAFAVGRLKAGHSGEGETPLAQYFAEAPTQHNAFNLALFAVQERPETPATRQFLTDMLNLLPADDWQRRTRVLGAIEGMLTRRTSGLGSSDGWESLGLFEPRPH